MKVNLEQRNFGKLDFKKFHPSGSLGVKLKLSANRSSIKNKSVILIDDSISECKFNNTLNSPIDFISFVSWSRKIHR